VYLYRKNLISNHRIIVIQALGQMIYIIQNLQHLNYAQVILCYLYYCMK